MATGSNASEWARPPEPQEKPMPCSSLRLRHMTCEELEMKEPMKFFSNDFLAVALFSGIGLVVSLIAVICNEQGSWF